MTHTEASSLLLSHKQELHDLGVASIALFGSVVRGEAREGSDVDVLVRFSKPVGLFEFLEVQFFLENLFGTKVDLVTEDALKPQLQKRIVSEAVWVVWGLAIAG